MVYAHDTEEALAQAAALVNTMSDGVDAISDRAGMAAFLDLFPMSGQLLGTDEELQLVRQLRARLRMLWSAGSRDEAAAMVNDILAEAQARPYLSKHDEYDWHLHVTGPEAPLAQRIGADAAMGFLDLIRADDLDRLRICAADDCEDVLVDLSRNKSRRFCDSGCGNRANVAAYRARKRTATTSGSRPGMAMPRTPPPGTSRSPSSR